MQSQQATTVNGIGIDVSSEKLDLAVRFSDAHYLEASFENNRKGILSLLSVLKRQETAATVPLVIESTGDFHLLSALMIKESDYLVKVINPVITKKYQKGSVRNAKSDPIDARRLADIAFLEQNLPDFKADLDDIIARKLVSQLAFLQKTAQQMTMSLKRFEETTSKVLGVKIDLRPMKQALLKVKAQQQIIKGMLEERMPEKARFIAKNMRGISQEKLAVLLAVIGDRQFDNADQLVAYIGLDPALRKSGKWQGRQKLSKRGNAYARLILFLMAWGLKQNNPKFKEYFDRLRTTKNKHYTTAMVATARKFLRFLFVYYFQGTKELDLSTLNV